MPTDVPGALNATATLIAAFAAAFGAILASLLTWRNSTKARQIESKTEAALEKIVKVGRDVYEVGKRVDGRLTELLASTAEAEYAKGIEEGRNLQKTENDEAENPEK